MVERSQRERSGGHAIDPFRSERAFQAEGERLLLFNTTRQEQPDSSWQPAYGEGQRLLRCRIEPVQVVDRHRDRRLRGECAQDADQPRCRCSRVGRLVGVPTQQRRRKAPLLNRRKRRPRFLENGADQVGEAGVRQLCFALGRTCLQDPKRALPSSTDCLPPDGRLPDAGLSVDDERTRFRRHQVEELRDRSELAFAADDRACRTDRLGHTASPLDT
jgi:hypothetical protein